MVSIPYNSPEQNGAATARSAPVDNDAGPSFRDLDNEALNRRWRDADIRSTPLENLAPRGKRNPKKEALLTTARAERDRIQEEVQRRLGLMSNEDLIGHLTRLEIDRHSWAPPSDGDNADNGDWPASLLHGEWQKRQEHRKEERERVRLEELEASVRRMDDARLASEGEEIEDLTPAERHPEQNIKLAFIRRELARRDSDHRLASSRRDKVRTFATIASLVVSMASFALAGVAYLRTQPVNSVISAGNTPGPPSPTPSASSSASNAPAEPVRSNIPSDTVTGEQEGAKAKK